MRCKLLRLDLHIHTRYSKDSQAPIASVVEHCQTGGLGLVAITDHNNIQGALEVQKAAPFPVIVGEEITSTSGHIIGLYLQEAVPEGLPPLETARQIKDQDGLVLVPHPFRWRRPSALGRRALEEILHLVDLIEGYNAHTIFPGDNAKAATFALRHSLPMVAGSDSHTAFELGRTYTKVPEHEYDGSPASLVRAVKNGEMVGRHPNPLLLIAPGFAKLRKMLA